MTTAQGIILLLAVVIAVSGLARRWRFPAPLILVIVGLIGSYRSLDSEGRTQRGTGPRRALASDPLRHRDPHFPDRLPVQSPPDRSAIRGLGPIHGDRCRPGRLLAAADSTRRGLRAGSGGGPSRRRCRHCHRPPGRDATPNRHDPRGGVAGQRRHRHRRSSHRHRRPRRGGEPVRGRPDFVIAAGGGVLVGVAVAYRHRQDPAIRPTDGPRHQPLDHHAVHLLPARRTRSTPRESWRWSSPAFSSVTRPNRIQNATSRISERHNWQTIQFLLENSVFLLIGLQVRSIVTDVADSSLGFGHIALACGACSSRVIILRPLWVFPATYLPRKIRSVGRTDPAAAWQYPAVVSWAGMRGVVTLAAAFVLPESVPHREVLILVAWS